MEEEKYPDLNKSGYEGKNRKFSGAVGHPNQSLDSPGLEILNLEDI